MSRRVTQKENTRKKIVETAYHLYSLHGFSIATSQIAKEAGVSHGTIFAHFPTVDTLLDFLIEDFGHTLAIKIHSLSENGNSIQELLECHIEILSMHESFYRRLISERNLLPENAQLTFADIQAMVAYHFNTVFERDIINQSIKKISVHMLFNTWMGLIHYYLLNKEFFSPNDLLLTRYKEELISTFLELIRQ